MQSIRSKLLFSSLGIIVALVTLDIFFFAVHFNLVKRYNDVLHNMITEYQVSEVGDNIIASYGNFIKNTNDPALEADYQARLQNIKDLFAQLDQIITSEDSRVIYVGLKNTVDGIVEQLQLGVQAAKQGNISNISDYYDEAIHKNYFVRENTAALILKELAHTEQLQVDIDRAQRLIEIFGFLALALVSLAGAWYALSFSRSLVRPIERLEELAKVIAGGRSDRTVDPELLELKDEAGSLARSFNQMVVNVEDKINTRTRELQEERARLIASINSLSLGFLLIDAQGNIFIANPPAYQIFGITADQMTLAHISDRLGKQFDVVKYYKNFLEGGMPVEAKDIMLGEKYLHVFLAPILLHKPEATTPEVIGATMLVEDVTEQKALDRSRDEFFSIASHELRTPLTAIRGNAAMLRDYYSEPMAPEGRQMVGDIVVASNRLIRIVNDFLDVSRIEQKKTRFEQAPFDVVQVIKETVEQVKELATKKGLELRFNEPTEKLPEALGDKDRTRQIITNLLGNAINYTTNGRITIDAQLKEREIKILVSDTGAGIPIENQSLLFHKFQQAGSSLLTRDVTQGTGLGLYISKLLAEAMNGTIGLESSEVGKGSTFSFTLPLASAKPPTPPPAPTTT
ncbi:MAG TPA: ATP-binding protein [Candidatus Paceibacterota bacterium]|nr:ATP-binding protein [Candidatus Paceibacterota bacterium]